MKILIITDRYPPHYDGGYEINCEITARELEQKGHQIIILTSSYGIKAPRRELKVYRLLHPLKNNTNKGAQRRLAELKNAVFSRRNYYIARNVVDEVKPDMAYIWRMGGVSIFPISAVQSRGIPVVYELGDYWLLDYKTDFMTSNLLKKAYRYLIHGGVAFRKLEFNNMIMISNALKNSYSEQGFPKDNISVIPRGIPEQYIKDENADNKESIKHAARLLYAGRIVREKGAHIAVEALHYLMRDFPGWNVSLDIIGTGSQEYLEELNKIIQTLGLTEKVTIKGQMTRDDLFRAYADYDIMLLPAIWEEPLGNTVIEAMASGLPVIASRVGGIPEMINDGINGLLVAPNNPRGLAEAVRRMVHDEGFYAQLRSAGLRTVRKKYEQGVITTRIERHLIKSLGVSFNQL